jgi:predicted extracellular nuclease
MRFPSLPCFAAIALPLALATAACGQAGTGTTSSPQSTGTSSTSSGGGGGGTTTTATGGGTPLRVMTFNTHNFFDDTKNSPGKQETVVTTAQYNDHRASVAAVIETIAPDVVMLQEIENLGVLEDLDKTLGNTFPERQLFEGNDPRGIDIGILSKIKIDKAVSHAADKFKLLGTQTTYSYARDCLEVHMTVGGKHVALLGVHFRSKGGDVAADDPDKRLAEAQHTRAIADEIAKADPSAEILVVGDFNDTTGSEAQKAVIAQNPTYVDVAASVQGGWSYTYQGQKALIDHMIGTPGLTGSLVAGSVTILHDADVSKASDHAPVAATFGVR